MTTNAATRACRAAGAGSTACEALRYVSLCKWRALRTTVLQEKMERSMRCSALQAAKQSHDTPPADEVEATRAAALQLLVSLCLSRTSTARLQPLGTRSFRRR